MIAIAVRVLVRSCGNEVLISFTTSSFKGAAGLGATSLQTPITTVEDVHVGSEWRLSRSAAAKG